MMESKIVSYLKLSAAIVLWSSIYHVAKYLVSVTDIATITAIRFTLTTLVLLLWYKKVRGNILENLRKRTFQELLLIFVIAIFGVFLYSLTFFSAEKYISGEEVVILCSFVPAMATILGYFILGQTVNKVGWAGIIIALIGAIIELSLSSKECGKMFCLSLVSDLSVGQLWALFASINLAIYHVLSKKAVVKYGLDSRTINTFSTTMAMFLFIINFGLVHKSNLFAMLHQPWLFWGAIIYVAFFGTALAYQWYMDALQHIEIGKAVVFLNAMPFCTILMGLFIHGNTLKFGQVIAGVIIVVGVLITNFSKRNLNSPDKR